VSETAILPRAHEVLSPRNMKLRPRAVLAMLALGTTWVACSSGGGGAIDDGGPADGGNSDGARSDASSDASAEGTSDGCPAAIPQSGTPCPASLGKKACSYGCNVGGPATAGCVDGKWSVGYLDSLCEPPPADGPFACGSTTCSATQY